MRETVSDLRRFLYNPEYYWFEEALPADPLLLLPSALHDTQIRTLLPQDNPQYLTGSSGEHTYTLLWARLVSSPFLKQGQAPVFAEIERILGVSRREHPGLELSYTGVNRFAAATRETILTEISVLTTLAVVFGASIALLGVRRLRMLFHLFLTLVVGVVWAFVLAFLIFDKVHVIAIVVATILIGVALDYGFHVVMHHYASGANSFAETLRSLRVPLLCSTFTSIGGFAFLSLSDLPIIRQLGVLVGAGLGCSVLCLLFYFPSIQVGGKTRIPRFLSADHMMQIRSWHAAFFGLVSVVALVGLLRLSWDDDIRSLQVKLVDLEENDRKIRVLFEPSDDRTVLVTYGDSFTGALASLHLLNDWMREQSIGNDQFFNLGRLLPNDGRIRDAWQIMRENPRFAEMLKKALSEDGFKSEMFEPFFNDLSKFAGLDAPPQGASLFKQFLSNVEGPWQDLGHVGSEMVWFATYLNTKDRGLEDIALGRDFSTLRQDKLTTLSDTVRDYRHSTFHLMAVGFAILTIALVLWFRLKTASRIIVVPLSAVFFTLGILGWFHPTLNLFHLIGFLLAFCLSIDYAAFSFWNPHEPLKVVPSIRLSCLTTLTSFGILTLSSFQSVRSLGWSVFLSVLFAFLICETMRVRISLSDKRARIGG